MEPVLGSIWEASPLTCHWITLPAFKAPVLGGGSIRREPVHGQPSMVVLYFVGKGAFQGPWLGLRGGSYGGSRADYVPRGSLYLFAMWIRGILGEVCLLLAITFVSLQIRTTLFHGQPMIMDLDRPCDMIIYLLFNEVCHTPQGPWAKRKKAI